MRLQELCERHRDRVALWWIHVRDAYPTGSPRRARPVGLDQPRDHETLTEVAGHCSAAIARGLPQLVGEADDRWATAYARITYGGGKGTGSFDVEELARRLETIVGAPGR